jgi:pimeloyl-ACP methyl ester carboxylesterase
VVVGVSMGGATALRFACVYPEKLDRWVACDFNCAASDANTKSWKDRVAIAEGPGDAERPEITGMRLLATQTVQRWFHPSVLRDLPAIARTMEDMVAANDVPGFAFGCQALWAYDLRAGYGGTGERDSPETAKTAMKNCNVPGLLVVGEGDGGGKLAEVMERYKGDVGPGGVELKKVADAGHLPMYEQPEAFWNAVKDFVLGAAGGN